MQALETRRFDQIICCNRQAACRGVKMRVDFRSLGHQDAGGFAPQIWGTCARARSLNYAGGFGRLDRRRQGSNKFQKLINKFIFEMQYDSFCSEISDVQSPPLRKQKKISQSNDRTLNSQKFQNFMKYFELVRNLQVDFQYMLELFNLDIVTFPSNNEVLNIQKMLLNQSGQIKKNWSLNEKKVLIWVIGKYCVLHACNMRHLRETDYHNITQFIFKRDVESVRQRWLQYIKVTLVDRPFTKIEDERIVQLFERLRASGTSKIWSQIASEMNAQSDVFRTGKQLRERWINYLDPALLKLNKKWTDAEDLDLLKTIQQRGRKWSEIAKALQRNENQVKNRFNSLLKREGVKESELEKLIEKLLWKLSKASEKSIVDSQSPDRISIESQRSAKYSIVIRSSNCSQDCISVKVRNFENLRQDELMSLTPCLINLASHQIYFPPSDIIKDVISNQQTNIKDDFAKVKMELERFDQEFFMTPNLKSSLSVISELKEDELGQLISRLPVPSSHESRPDSAQCQVRRSTFFPIERYWQPKLPNWKAKPKYQTDFLIKFPKTQNSFRSLPQLISV